ncbi:MAG: UDP-N-acetylglucosamine 1-carboxyvinyltransferase [Acidobacteriota bacterium]|jgi:UDP-N-acetylglucosamine 1-carboxyvinyltransferase|nr:UDP-N-acetylglucosamine 1-carboxyvinyltransferase [Acidobacteriota bacterium]
MQPQLIRIQGGRPLHGRVVVAGAKNAALPELAAALLTGDRLNLASVPDVADIHVMLRALAGLGAETNFNSGRVTIHLSALQSSHVPPEIVQTSRASILLLGPLLARAGEARVSLPGGCPIGDRKFDFHLAGLRRMGAEIRIEKDHIIGHAPRLKGVDFEFPGVTVTGTENLLMAAVLAEGETVLRNCAREPEIADLMQLLGAMGARVATGDEGRVIRIQGVAGLSGASHRVIADRIEMGTYLIAGALGENDITVEGGEPGHVMSLLDILTRADIPWERNGAGIRVRAAGTPRPVEVETRPFPGFPTDLQAQMTTLLTQVPGVSLVRETIFNNRFQHAEELRRMGADIFVSGDTARIQGPTPLKGCLLRATDLRASAALILGGLIASGETVVSNAGQLFRGYENLPEKFAGLGARIQVEGGDNG